MSVTKDSFLRRHLPGFLLLASLLVAVGFFLIWPPEWEARTLFFPGTTSARLTGERRLVPRTRARQEEISVVIEELVLGPAQITHGRLVPRQTRVQAVVLDQKDVYVDLSPDVMFGGDEVRLEVLDGLAGIEDTLFYNFRWLDSVTLTIGGQEPDAPAFMPIEES